jgi:phosphoglycolate phosphatase-like HAD superfamily hydrolase
LHDGLLSTKLTHCTEIFERHAGRAAQVDIPRERVLVVGTYTDDCRAAQAAGLAWMPTGSFFEQSKTAEARAKENFDPFLDVDELP